MYYCKECGQLDEDMWVHRPKCMVVNAVVNKSRGVSETVGSHKPDQAGSTPAPATRKKDRHKPRLEYMKEYMRKRRAKSAQA